MTPHDEFAMLLHYAGSSEALYEIIETLTERQKGRVPNTVDVLRAIVERRQAERRELPQPTLVGVER